MKYQGKFYVGSNHAGKGRLAHLLDPMSQEDYDRIFTKEDKTEICYICEKAIDISKGDKLIYEGNRKYRHKRCIR